MKNPKFHTMKSSKGMKQLFSVRRLDDTLQCEVEGSRKEIQEKGSHLTNYVPLRQLRNKSEIYLKCDLTVGKEQDKRNWKGFKFHTMKTL